LYLTEASGSALGTSAILCARDIRGRAAFARLCDWQQFSLDVLTAWAAVVAFIVPVMFGFT
jgi:hypothetical protein